MNVSLRRLRRTIPTLAAATLAVATAGCFNVKEVAQQPGGGEANSAVAEPSVSFGEEVGPLDVNVDGTLGDVSQENDAPAPMAFGASVRPAAAPLAEKRAVPDPPALNDSDFGASPPTIATSPLESTSPTPPTFGDAAPLAPGPGDFQLTPTTPPAFGPTTTAAPPTFPPGFGSTNDAEAGPLAEVAAAPALTPNDDSGFAPSAPALTDPEASAAIEPMRDPASGLSAIEEATPEAATVEEASPGLAPLAETVPALTLDPTLPTVDAEEAAAPALTIEAPSTLEEMPAPALEMRTPGAALVSPGTIASEETIEEEVAPSIDAQADLASSPEIVAESEAAPTPFEEDDFAPRFGPGRQLIGGTPPAPSTAPPTTETDMPEVLAQQPATPGIGDLAQIGDPAGIPPASLRPSGSTAATLPDFDPTRGANLAPPAVDLDDFEPTPDPASDPAIDPATPTPGPASPAPGAPGPMPGPARDPALSGASPAPAPGPARSDDVPPPPAEKNISPKRTSTSAEIAEAARTWTDASGSHSLKAAILELENGRVRLESPDGERFSVSVASLSRYDQGYVKGLAEGTVGKEPRDRSWTDASGEFGVLGKLTEADGDVVRIVGDDGKRLKIEKALLSEYDRGFVDGIKEAKSETR